MQLADPLELSPAAYAGGREAETQQSTEEDEEAEQSPIPRKNVYQLYERRHTYIQKRFNQSSHVHVNMYTVAAKWELACTSVWDNELNR